MLQSNGTSSIFQTGRHVIHNITISHATAAEIVARTLKKLLSDILVNKVDWETMLKPEYDGS